MKIRSLLIIFVSTFIFVSLTGCDDAADHRKDEKYRKEQEEEKAFQARREAIKKTIDARGEAEVAYYEDEGSTVPEGEAVEIFKLGSDMAVNNGGQNAVVTVDEDVFATELWTYHYNDGRGAAAGTVQMVSSDGTTYGPWQAELYNSTYWVSKPNLIIPAGEYTVIDSDPASWSQNGETGGQGMTWMMGIY